MIGQAAVVREHAAGERLAGHIGEDFGELGIV